jgi:hypothetical protein
MKRMPRSHHCLEDVRKAPVRPVRASPTTLRTHGSWATVEERIHQNEAGLCLWSGYHDSDHVVVGPRTFFSVVSVSATHLRATISLNVVLSLKGKDFVFCPNRYATLCLHCIAKSDQNVKVYLEAKVKGPTISQRDTTAREHASMHKA